uniref:Flavin-containing monooxygenase n=1 Tax=Parastrongyloides trichosuri TaxID=131310 RepID=A0A0N4Z0S2_PARTI
MVIITSQIPSNISINFGQSEDVRSHSLRSIRDSEIQISGIRLEPLEDEDSPIKGYSKQGIALVIPKKDVKVVVFGINLDKIDKIGFTRLTDCTKVLKIIPITEFKHSTPQKIDFETNFGYKNTLFKLCYHKKEDEAKKTFTLVTERDTFISTEIPPRVYILPFWIQIFMIILFIFLSGLFSGLNLGLMSLTPQELELIYKSGSDQEKKYAEAIIPIRKSGNLLLCSLLIGNVIINCSISILFDDLTTGIIALIASSSVIVVFGEIFPQSLCVKKGLAVGARTIWITRFFMILTFPIAYPISKILDWVIGVEVTSYDRKKLMELIKLTTRNETGLAEELKIAVGAMEIADKTVKDVMTKIDDVFMLPETTILNAKTVTEIVNMGYTRIPIYAKTRNNVVSLLFIKDLALMDPDDNFTVKTVCAYNEHVLRFVSEDTPLKTMLEEFKKGDYHLAMVYKKKKSKGKDNFTDLCGLVTLEDIVEEILQAEIVDETDVITDNVHKTRRRMKNMKYLSHCFHESSDIPEVISLQLQMATVQFLSSFHPIFNSSRISQHILSKLIKHNVQKIDLTTIHDPNLLKAPSTKTKLYIAGEKSDRFILILEGRVSVTLGKSSMTFEASPWHPFGTEILDQLLTICPVITEVVNPLNSDRKSKIFFTPDYTCSVIDKCTYLELTAPSYIIGYKTSLLQREVEVSPLKLTPRVVTPKKSTPKVMVKVCVVGAGASGLPAIKCALENKFEVVCYEKSNEIGGLWRFKPYPCPDEGTVMRSTVINTSKEMTAYSDFPPPAEVANFMHNSELLKYFKSYADHFNLIKHIQFSTAVINIERHEKFEHNGKWKVTTKNIVTDEVEENVFDSVMLCTGHHTTPYWPEKFVGQDSFKGKIIHSHDYKDFQEFVDKKVVVIGIGNSGGDIAVELSKCAKNVYLSTRSGTWVINRVFDQGEPSDQVYLNRFNYHLRKFLPSSIENSVLERKVNQRFDHGRFGLKPKHRFLGAHVTVNDELPNRIISGTVIIKSNISSFGDNDVHFDDDTSVEDVDVVIFATGFSFSFPIVEKGTLIDVKDNVVELYKFMYLPTLVPHNTLTIIGLIQPTGSIMPISEMQCRVHCANLSGNIKLPSKSEMIKDAIRYNEKNMKTFVKSRRHTIQVHYVEYMEELAELLKVKPKLLKYLFSDLKLFKTLYFHGLFPYQYRLNGIGAWSGARDAIIGAEERTFNCTRTRKTPETMKSKPICKVHICRIACFCD